MRRREFMAALAALAATPAAARAQPTPVIGFLGRDSAELYADLLATGTTTSTLEIGPLQLHPLHEIIPAAERFAEMTRLRLGLVIGADSFFFFRKERLGALALPAMFGFREFALAGGLIGYGASPAEQHRVVGHYIGRILNGEEPANLPCSSRRKSN